MGAARSRRRRTRRCADRRPGRGREAHRSRASPIRRPTSPAALADRDDVRRLRELADELTADQRLVLACQVALDMDCQEFCARFGWSAEKFRKVAQRARARLRALVADYEAGERCRGLADDLAAYVAHVADGEQSERVRRHLTNCPACAHTARELERVARGVGALLPLPPTVDPEVVHRFGGGRSRVLGACCPSGTRARARRRPRLAPPGRRAAAGGGAVTAGSSVLGLGAAKLGVTALCVAGATGGYVVCDQIGLFSGPLPRERHHVATTANAVRKAPPSAELLAGGHAYPRADHPHHPPAARHRSPSAHRGSSASSASSSGQASNEFGFEGAGGATGSTPASSSSSSPSARAASAGTQSAATTPSASRPPSAASGHRRRRSSGSSRGATVDQAPLRRTASGGDRLARPLRPRSRRGGRASRNAPGVTPKRRRKALTKCEGWR